MCIREKRSLIFGYERRPNYSTRINTAITQKAHEKKPWILQTHSSITLRSPSNLTYPWILSWDTIHVLRLSLGKSQSSQTVAKPDYKSWGSYTWKTKGYTLLIIMYCYHLDFEVYVWASSGITRFKAHFARAIGSHFFFFFNPSD